MTFLHALVIILGAREIHRHTNALRVIRTEGERYAWHRWGRQWSRIWGIGALLIGLGGFWAPIASAGWIVAGIAPIAATPTPCGWRVVNTYFVLKSLRNLFFIGLGASFIAHGIGLL